MQNISGLQNLISNAGEKNITAVQMERPAEGAGATSSITFRDLLDSSLKPVMDEKEKGRETAKSSHDVQREVEKKDDHEKAERTKKDDYEKVEGGKKFDREKESSSITHNKSENPGDKINQSDEKYKYAAGAEILKTQVAKKSEINSKEKVKYFSNSRSDNKKSIFSDGFMSELFLKVGKKNQADGIGIKNKIKSDDSRKNKETISSKLNVNNAEDLKNIRNTVLVTLDPEKWKVHGRVETKELLLTENQNKKNHIKNMESKKSSTDGKGENQKDHSSAKFNEMKNLFGETGSVRSQPLGSNQISKEQFVADNKNIFNELVDKARLNLGPDGNSTATIKMHPASLGSLTMNLRVMNNSLEAKILVDSESAKRLIMDDIENLKMEMKSQGIQVDSFTVKIKESFFSGLEYDSQQQNPFLQGDKSDSNNFSENKNSDEKFYDNFTNQISGIIDDNEYGSSSYEMNAYDGSINLSA